MTKSAPTLRRKRAAKKPRKTMRRSRTPAGEKDLAQTPPEWVRQVETFLAVRFVLDVCALPNTKKAPSFYGSEPDLCGAHQVGVDALAQPWANDVRTLSYDAKGYLPAAFMNPPFSAFPAFTAKAAEEAAKGCIVVGLVKDDRSTGWWRDNIAGKAAFTLEPPCRIQFLRPDGEPFRDESGKKTAANFGSVFVVWLPWVLPGGPYPLSLTRPIPDRLRQVVLDAAA